MLKKVVEYRDDEFDVLITVRAARVKDGIRRTLIMNEQLSTNLGEEVARHVEAPKGEEGETLPLAPLGAGTIGIRLLRMYTYPACVCSVDKIENLDPTKKELSPDISIEDFLELPDALVMIWEQAAYEANPHWLPRVKPLPGKESEEAKKASLSNNKGSTSA